MNFEAFVAIGSMGLAAACLVWLGITLWYQQRELRKQAEGEMWERRIQR